MRISDWSSDVCSSDLAQAAQHADRGVERDVLERAAAVLLEGLLDRRARPPFGGEGVVGVDREGPVGRRRRQGGSGNRGGCKESEKAHASLPRSMGRLALRNAHGRASWRERGCTNG